MKPRSPTRWERMSVPRSMILAMRSRPAEILILSTAVSIAGNVLSTRFDSMPGSYGVYCLGSNVSVWAMPPAIQSRMRLSARGAIFVALASRRASDPASAAKAAAPEVRRKLRRERPARIERSMLCSSPFMGSMVLLQRISFSRLRSSSVQQAWSSTMPLRVLILNVPLLLATTLAGIAKIVNVKHYAAFHSWCTRGSFRIHRKCQQHIPRHFPELPITGVHVQRPAHHRWPGTVERAALGLHSVHGLIFHGGVHVPDDAAIGGRVGAQVAVQRAREDYSRNQRHGRRLRGAASRLAATRRRRGPDALSGGQLQREHPARLVEVLGGIVVRDSHVDILAIRRVAPLHSSERTAFAYAHAPQHFALLVRIDGVHHPGLLPGNQRALAVGQIHQVRRASKIEVRAVGLRAIVPRGTTEIEGIALGQLARP